MTKEKLLELKQRMLEHDLDDKISLTHQELTNLIDHAEISVNLREAFNKIDSGVKILRGSWKEAKDIVVDILEK